ncbi:LysR family transcriptional regulator [Achromobacter sp. Marseille-Q0513]|jgi:DNA-binding transcriptional LysR family regulator|uniref:LysR substrate-binding domain-containing protein n=1 Tax=Achromobacter sp. Marseille-Q0513 TaxID=2829161 RepID=UPI001B9A261B|nr:LysR substrate-binding domain-containing protein [Achromobacter sp. Marseille-Q0513]MBR8654790.1 LysR family transcriptional regulator [Achromobacter sp. Marseille-Q0513]
MHDLNDLYYFVQVVRNGGFAPAGRALGIPKSRLSRRIALLEERLGVRLIQRSTRSFAVTELGQEYYEQCLSMLAGAEAAQEVIDRTHAEPQGTIRLSAPPALIHYFLGELIARFMVKCPKVQVYLKSFSRPVDVLREGYDLAVRVRFGPIESSDLVMKPLGMSGQRLVAAPALARAVALPADPGALGQLPTLALGIDGRESHWKLDGPDGARLSVPFSPRLVTDDMMALKQAAVQGVGVAALPLLMIREELADGRLVDVGRPWAPEPGSVHAVFPSRRGLLPGVRELLDFMGAEYQKLARREREECRELGERP